MKKLTILSLVVISSLLLTGCFKRDDFEDITIYTSAYPVEYITERLYGDNSEINSIYPEGVNINNYVLSDNQIKDYADSDLFVFNGVSNETNYVVPMVDENKNLKIIDTSLTMDYEYKVEELWLDPSNFLMLAQNIRNGLKEYIASHYLKEEIDEKYDEIKLEISEIDADIRLMSESATNKTIVVGNDTFNYLNKYGFNVISLEENENLTEKVLVDVDNLIKSGVIDYIFLPNNMEESETIKNIKENNSNIEIVTLHTLGTITNEEILNKDNFLTITKDNMDKFKNELYE